MSDFRDALKQTLKSGMGRIQSREDEIEKFRQSWQTHLRAEAHKVLAGAAHLMSLEFDIPSYVSSPKQDPLTLTMELRDYSYKLIFEIQKSATAVTCRAEAQIPEPEDFHSFFSTTTIPQESFNINTAKDHTHRFVKAVLDFHCHQISPARAMD